MNKLRIRAIALGLLTGKLADAGLGYNQKTYGTAHPMTRKVPDAGGRDCGTTACVAGTAIALYNPGLWEAFLDGRRSAFDMFDGGKAILDLDSPTANALFDGSPVGYEHGEIKSPAPKQTPAVLYKLAEGEGWA